MLLSRRSLLAIAAVVDIALHARPTPVAAKSLAARHNLPPRHLETVLQALVRLGILKGVRGPRGGYELARERRRITAGDIVRAAMSVDRRGGPDAAAGIAPRRPGRRRRSSPAPPRPSWRRSTGHRRRSVPAGGRAARVRRRLGRRRFHDLRRVNWHFSTRVCVDSPQVRIEEPPMADAARKLADPTPARTPGRGRIYDSITDTIGDTPLVRLEPPRRRSAASRPTSWPSSSSSTRSRASRTASASAMIDALEAAGAIKPGGTARSSRPPATPASRSPSSPRRAATG